MHLQDIMAGWIGRAGQGRTGKLLVFLGKLLKLH